MGIQDGPQKFARPHGTFRDLPCQVLETSKVQSVLQEVSPVCSWSGRPTVQSVLQEVSLVCTGFGWLHVAVVQDTLWSENLKDASTDRLAALHLMCMTDASTNFSLALLGKRPVTVARIRVVFPCVTDRTRRSQKTPLARCV